jgi:Protein of unknown function (DUF3866)
VPLSLRRGSVTAIVERQSGLARIEVDGRPCVAFPRLTGPIALGDEVIVNTQARELGLGSGGFDVLHVNLTRGLGLAPEPGAHIMKLPYTSLQSATRHAEEDLPQEPVALDGIPVVCCSLHSQVAPVCAGIGAGVRVAYVQLQGGALPISLSDAVRALRQAGLLETTVAVGSCLDGDAACVSVASALAWAAAREFETAVCSIGPGIVGTATYLGHGGVAAAEAANAASALGGRPVIAPRVSQVDSRDRHRVVSHHTLAVLELSLGRPTVAWPDGLRPPPAVDYLERVDVSGWREACAEVPLRSMGRGPEDDPWFFAAAFAAGRLVRRWLR